MPLSLYAPAQRKPFTFHGVEYRSKLEASWAALFETLGLFYEYEPVTFVRPDGQRYTPDFRLGLPDGRCDWYEVKPGLGFSMRAEKERWWLCELSRRPDVRRAAILPGAATATLKAPHRICCFESGERIEWQSRAERVFRPPVSAVLHPETAPLSWDGPFPWQWVARAWQVAGKAGTLAGLRLWHAANSGALELTSTMARAQGTDHREAKHALSAMARAGLLVAHRRAGYASAIELCPPPRPWNIRGPLPIAWVHRAAELGRNPLIAGLAIWRLVGSEGDSCVLFENTRSQLVPALMSAEAKTDAQRKLAGAGLISAKARGGHASLVTILVEIGESNG
jgi:hypothetical protein